MTLNHCKLNRRQCFKYYRGSLTAALSILRQIQPKLYILPQGLAGFTLWNAYQRQCMIHVSAEKASSPLPPELISYCYNHKSQLTGGWRQILPLSRTPSLHHSPRTGKGDFTWNMQPLRCNFGEAVTFSVSFFFLNRMIYCAVRLCSCTV